MKNGRILWGMLFILGGIFLVISKLGFFPELNVFSILVTIVLVAIIIKSIVYVSFSGILIPLALIGIIYDDYLGITAVTPWTLLIAAVFASIGLSLIFKKKRKGWKVSHHGGFDNSKKIDMQDESYVSHETSFGSSVKYVNTDKLVRADFQCKFGAMKIYFDNATMEGQNAVLNIDVNFAGMEIFVPNSWSIEENVDVTFGSIEYKNRNGSVITNTLTLVGDVNFSGVEITFI